MIARPPRDTIAQTLPAVNRILTASAQARYNRTSLLYWFVGWIALSCAVALLLLRGTPAPNAIGWTIFLACVAAMIYQPRYGVYMALAFSLAGDALLMPWYPFVKNLSSIESLFYVHGALIFNPLEITLVVTLVSWLGRGIMRRHVPLHANVLVLPAIVFIIFATIGFVFGMSRGGDLVIALWEVRSIYYLPLMIILVTNLIEKREHINILVWCAIIALSINSLVGAWFVATELQFRITSVLRIAEHAFSIQLNSIFVLAFALWYFGGSYKKLSYIVALLPFMLIAYVANQRRAGYVALGVATILFLVYLYVTNRRLFWLIVPTGAILFAIYLAVFWNSGGARSGGSLITLPARVVRSVIAPTVGTEEESSSVYRMFENANILYTIQTSPWMGVGFGQKFLIIRPMADISFFAWWEYFTHNSIVWIWMKAGLGGFLSVIFLIGLSLAQGIRTVLQMPRGDMGAIAFMALSYVVMHFVYAYVDMSWDPQSMIYLGTCMALLAILPRIVDTPVALPPQRWPWQRQRKAPEGLRPLA
ncbi:MAG: O-antigen ligase family protein [Chloroflexaceae bacterium]|jgi:hypothetical protein|nr:O-antigen ligase family protein [Chloroflexaceae bacterium]